MQDASRAGQGTVRTSLFDLGVCYCLPSSLHLDSAIDRGANDACELECSQRLQAEGLLLPAITSRAYTTPFTNRVEAE